jgi:hypothetical protein
VASDVDPRFDPAFQRGFESTTPRVERAERVQPGLRVERVETSPPNASQAESSEPSPVTPPRVELADPPPARNPWLAVLWIKAAVLTIAAVLAQYIATEITYSPTAPTATQEYVIPAVFGALAPTLFAAGLATAIAALVIHALRWQPRD